MQLYTEMKRMIYVLLLIVAFGSLACGQQTAQKELAIPIQPGDVQITTTSLPTAIIGSEYLVTLEATGGIPGYRWLVVSSTLADGSVVPGDQGLQELGLQLSTAGVIFGTVTASPTRTTSGAFIVEVEDSSGTASRLKIGWPIAAP